MTRHLVHMRGWLRVKRDRKRVAQLVPMGGQAKSLSSLEQTLGNPDCLRKYKAELPLSYALAVRLIAAYADLYASL